MNSTSRFTFKNIDWVPFLFLTLSPIVGVGLTIYYFWNNPEPNYWFFLVALIFYALTAMSITAGYHRHFSHCAYDAPVVTKLFYALFGAAAFQNSIYKWATEHRIHHRFVDTPEDPYNIYEGFWYAHIGWMLFKTPQQKYFNAYSRDFRNDPIVMWQHKYYIPIAITMGIIFPAVIGYFMGSIIGGLAIPGLLRIVALHHGTFFINSLCHMWGSQPYTNENTAKDNLILAVFTFGEGYHNYHHKFANDYRNGIRWYHWDPTKWAIKFKSFFGLATNLKKVPDEVIFKARIDFEFESFWGELSVKHDQLKVVIEDYKKAIHEAQARFAELKKEYYELIKQQTLENKKRLEQIKLEIQEAKNEMAMQINQWRLFKQEALALYC